MTEHEIERLRELLGQHVRRYGKDQYISELLIPIYSSGAYNSTTRAELIVFGLNEYLVPTGQIAYMAYEELIDIVAPSRFDEETRELICKARVIVPEEDQYGRMIVFKEGVMERNAFLWFADFFFYLPNRQAAAIYAKHEWNNMDLIKYADEQR